MDSLFNGSPAYRGKVNSIATSNVHRYMGEYSVSKILNSGIILKTSTHVDMMFSTQNCYFTQNCILNTLFYISNLIWHTVPRRVDEVIPSDHP